MVKNRGRLANKLGEKVLITGVAGFIGSNFAERLRSLDFEVVGIDDFSNGIKENISNLAGEKGFKLVRGNILKEKELIKACSGVNSIIHLAAQPSVARSAKEPWFDFNENAIGTFRVLEAARKKEIETVIFASSSTVYGEAPIPTPENHPLRPISNYGASKAAAEMYCGSYGHSYGIKTASLRYYNIYGPKTRKGVMFDFFKKLQNDSSRLEVLGTGDQKKDYLYIDDTLDATLMVASRGELKGEAYNVGSGKSHSVKELVSLILGILDLKGKTKVVYKGGLSWRGDVQKTLPDIRKLKGLGFSFKFDLWHGLERFLEWYEREYGAVVGT